MRYLSLIKDIDYAQSDSHLEKFYERFLKDKYEELEADEKFFITVYSNKNQGAVWKTDLDLNR
jgi:hypothetical protein